MIDPNSTRGRVLELSRQGKWPGEIADILGRPARDISAIISKLRGAGLLPRDDKRRTKKRPWTEAERADIKRRFDLGESVGQIASAYRVKSVAISRLLAPPGKGPYTAEQDADLEARWIAAQQAGERNTEAVHRIGFATGRSPGSVHARLIALGIIAGSDAKPVEALRPWPKRARFDGKRELRMKDGPPPRYTPAHVEASVGSAAAMCVG
jgi:hypothetical protein